MHLIFKGYGTFFLEGKKWELGPNEGFIIPPGKRNKYIANTKKPWHYVWAAWEDMENEMPERFTFSLMDPCIKVPQSDILDLKNIMHSSNSNFDKQNLSVKWFTFFMHTLLEQYGRKTISAAQKFRPGTAVYGKKMKAFILENYSNRINAADVAEYVNLERSYASRIFKKEFGIGIYNFISDIRFRKACKLLNSSYSVKEICFSCGYSDYGNFLRTFKRTSGLSPTEYRQLRGKKPNPFTS